MDIEGLAEDPPTHRRALNVPTRTPLAPRARPTRFARLGRLPQGKVARRAFATGRTPTFALLLVGRTIAQTTVLRILRHVEKDIAIGRISEPLGDEFFDKGDDLVDVVCRARHSVDLVDPQGLQIRHIIGRHLRSQLKHRDPLFAGPYDQLIIHIGDVDDPSHLIAAMGQIAFDGIEDHRSNHVSDVGLGIDGRTAQIHSHFSGLDRPKRLLDLRQSVIDSDGVFR